MTVRSLMLAALALVASCAEGGPTGPTPPSEPQGTVITFDYSDRIALRNPRTGVASDIPGVTGTLFRFLDDQSVVIGGTTDGTATIRRIDVTSGAVATLGVVGNGISIASVAPSPDRTRIAFVVWNWFGDGRTSLHELNVASGVTHLLWDGVVDGLAELEWHPDGKRLFALRDNGLVTELVRFDFRSSQPRLDTIPGGKSRLAGGFSLSPDGTRIIIAKWKVPTSGGGERYVLHEIRLDRPTVATDLGVVGYAPRHGPRGDWVAYSTYDEHTLRLVRLADKEDREFPGIGGATGFLALDWR